MNWTRNFAKPRISSARRRSTSIARRIASLSTEEQAAQIESRAIRLSAEVDLANLHAAELVSQMAAQRENLSALRGQTRPLEDELREATEQASSSVHEQSHLESRIEELRKLAGQLVEQSAQDQAETLNAEEAAERHATAEMQRSAAMRNLETEWSALTDRVKSAETAFDHSTERGNSPLRFVWCSLASRNLRRRQVETTQQLEGTRENLSGERARLASIEQILKERAYTADAVQKLFSFNASNSGSYGNGDDSLKRRFSRDWITRRLRRSPGTIRSGDRAISSRRAGICGRRIIRSSARGSGAIAGRGRRAGYVLRGFGKHSRCEQDGKQFLHAGRFY